MAELLLEAYSKGVSGAVSMEALLEGHSHGPLSHTYLRDRDETFMKIYLQAENTLAESRRQLCGLVASGIRAAKACDPDFKGARPNPFIGGRYYGADSEGMAIHDDLKIPSELIAVRTLFGRAKMIVKDLSGTKRKIDVCTDSVVVIQNCVLHEVGPPLDGPRAIEAVGVTLRT